MATAAVRPTVRVRVRGEDVPVDSLSISSDSPVDLHLPPQVGGVAGATADVDLSPAQTVGSRPETAWSPTLRARPGDPVTCQVDGVQLFRGIVGDFGLSARDFGLSLPCVDPLSDTDTTFSAPATLKRLAPLPGSSQERPVGCSSLFYVDRALAALGANSTARLAGRSVLHVPMAGCAQPVVGTVTRATRRASDGTAVSPWVEPLFRPMSSGRLGVLEPHYEWITDASRSEATVGSWHLTAEIDTTDSGHGYVRTVGVDNEHGFGFRLDANRENLQVQTWDADNEAHPATYVDQGQTLTDIPIPAAAERVLLAYNVTAKTLQLRLQAPDSSAGWVYDLTPATGTAPPFTTTTRQVRARLVGFGRWGGVSLMSRAGWIGVVDNEFINEPRAVSYDMTAARMVRWSRQGHPPVEGEEAVAWLMRQVAEMRTFIYSDHQGVVHLSDPADWPTLPVSHTITDGFVAGDIDLDDLAVTLARRRRYSRVRVTGTTVAADIAWGPGMKPNRIYAGAREFTLQPGDDPVELWLEPREGTFWGAPPDLDFRWFGEPVTEPWHKPDDAARGRGSWWGGFVRNAENDNMYRWAVPGDVIYTVEQVTFSRVKITITPGPGLQAGEEFVNLPNPESESLRAYNPSKLSQPLPVLRGSGVGTFGEVEGVSTEITPDPDGWGDLEEYVHEAGMSVQATSQATELAQILADSHMNDFGAVQVEVAFDASVRIGQRVHIKPTSRSDVTLDGVITGIPTREVSAGAAPRMSLKLWVLAVDVHSVTYGERRALVAAQAAEDGLGTSYGADRARHSSLTYAAERDTSNLTAGPNLAPLLTLDGWNATLGNDTLTVVTEDGARALKVTEDSGGTSLYLHPVDRPPVQAGDVLYLSAQAKVTQAADLRWWVVGQDGAVVEGGNDPYNPTQAPADGWVTLTHHVTVTAPGTVRVNLQARGGMFATGQGFFARNIIIRRLR